MSCSAIAWCVHCDSTWLNRSGTDSREGNMLEHLTPVLTHALSGHARFLYRIRQNASNIFLKPSVLRKLVMPYWIKHSKMIFFLSAANVLNLTTAIDTSPSLISSLMHRPKSFRCISVSTLWGFESQTSTQLTCNMSVKSFLRRAEMFFLCRYGLWGCNILQMKWPEPATTSGKVNCHFLSSGKRRAFCRPNDTQSENSHGDDASVAFLNTTDLSSTLNHPGISTDLLLLYAPV